MARRTRWYQNFAGDWFVENGDVFDRFAESYVNSPTMTAEELEQRIDRYIKKRSSPAWTRALLNNVQRAQLAPVNNL